jgi:hypothetical protein
MNNMRKQRGLIFCFECIKFEEEISLVFFQKENIRKLMKKKLNVLEQYHLLKIKQEHFHIGLCTSLGSVRLIK